MWILLYENWFVIHNCMGNLFSTEAGHITSSGLSKRPAASERQYHQPKNTSRYFLHFQLLYIYCNLPEGIDCLHQSVPCLVILPHSLPASTSMFLLFGSLALPFMPRSAEGTAKAIIHLLSIPLFKDLI